MRAGGWLVLALASAAACDNGKAPAGGPAGLAAPTRPECPQDTFLVTLTPPHEQGATPVTFTSVPLAGVQSHVPEFNDCQRFILSNDRYGPMVAIFAAGRLDTLYQDPVQIVEREQASASAEILSYDGDYPPLHIRTGFNCLYLWRVCSSSWNAAMQPVDLDAGACLKPPQSGRPLLPLDVRVISDPKLRDVDYPPVARWDWDYERKQQYIGIRCGAAWCEVGAPGFISSRRHRADTLPNPEAMPDKGTMSPNEKVRTVQVKGWYDEQRLAIPATVGNAGLATQQALGTAIPHPQLGLLSTVDDFSEWRPVATLILHAAIPAYKSKLALDTGPNTVHFCAGTAASCEVPETAATGCDPDSRGVRWWARIKTESGEVSYRCVKRRLHPGIEIPATARWRWAPDDEKTWIRCPEGCCTLQ